MIGAIAVFLGGGLGAVSRYGANALSARWLPGAPLPLATLAVNVVGCGLLGAVVPLLQARGGWSPAAQLAVTTGFLGGLTTFSTFGLETVSLLQRGSALGVLNAALHLGLGLGAAAIGLWLGGRLA